MKYALIAGFVACGALFSTVGYYISNLKWNKKISDEVVSHFEEVQELSDWDVLILATIKTESDFDFLAKGDTGDLGLLQETEIYVEDVNRILGDQVYSHTDAFDPEKALEMWDVYQKYYNPNKDISRAINLHNPKGDNIGYSVKVRKNIDWVKRYEKVRKMMKH